jgi:hypothetical protein
VPWDPIDDAVAALDADLPRPKGQRTDNGHSNGRGSASARRARKLKLIRVYGDGTYVACYNAAECGREQLTVETVTVDRILRGVDGGTYRWDNIRPACLPCNATDGNKYRWERQGTPDDFRRDA